MKNTTDLYLTPFNEERKIDKRTREWKAFKERVTFMASYKGYNADAAGYGLHPALFCTSPNTQKFLFNTTNQN